MWRRSILVMIALTSFPATSTAQCVDLRGSEIRVGEFCSPHQTYDSMGFTAAAAQENYLYLFQLFRGLVVVDISVPSEPEYLSLLDINSSGGFTSRGGLALNDSIAYIAAGDLMVASVNDPFAPSAVAVLATRESARDVVCVGTTLLVADNFAGITSFDISDPTAPALQDSLLLPGATTRVVQNGSLVFGLLAVFCG